MKTLDESMLAPCRVVGTVTYGLHSDGSVTMYVCETPYSWTGSPTPGTGMLVCVVIVWLALAGLGRWKGESV